MIIAVENGLDTVKKALIAHGHRVVDLHSAASFHAAVYVNHGISDIHVPQNTTKNTIQSDGVFLVNAYGRTPEEICAIIGQKAYGKLF